MTNPLNNDTCVYIEWVAGDQGNRTPRPATWWVSPDVDIVAPTQGQAIVGRANTVRCKPHAVAGCLDPDGDVIIQAFVADPSVSFTPQTAPLIASAAVPAANLGPAGIVRDLSWTPTGLGAQSPGHRCLLIRAFPEGFSPSNSSFFMGEGDRHIGQHNIQIVKATSTPGGGGGAIGPSADGQWDIPVGFANLSEEQAEVLISVDQDREPDRYLMTLIDPLLKEVEVVVDFKGFAGLEIPLGLEFAGETEVHPKKTLPPTTKFPDGIRVGPGDLLGGQVLRAGVDLGGLRVRAGDVVGGRLVSPTDPLDGFVFETETVLFDEAVTIKRALPRHKKMRWEQLNRLKWTNRTTVEAALDAGMTGTFQLTVDLRDAPVGTAFTYHTQQTDSEGRPEGGLTTVVIKVD